MSIAVKPEDIKTRQALAGSDWASPKPWPPPVKVVN
jgi:hypothetical protein